LFVRSSITDLFVAFLGKRLHFSARY